MAKPNPLPLPKSGPRHEACIFCRIARGEVPAQMVAHNPDMAAFRDTNPQAPTHILVIPKRHIASLDDAMDSGLLGQLLSFAAAIARQEKISKTGYRIAINTGKQAGQSVDHLHIHVLGGRELAWPPG
ncbi:MAG TPA: histidine triad nucleotide-binding protein [Gemmatimonadaceae bacterium]|nr:histidine triad nucleotide-binding protein [Gemmatimonadaceae bacterium]